MAKSIFANCTTNQNDESQVVLILCGWKHIAITGKINKYNGQWWLLTMINKPIIKEMIKCG